MKAAIYSFLTFLFSTTITYCQTIVVINNSTNQPIENVAIFNTDYSLSIITDEIGKADISKFKITDSLHFQHTSFDPYVICKKDIEGNQYKIKLQRKIVILPEFVLTASKWKESKREVPHMVDVITPLKMKRLHNQTSADILSSTGNVFVQKSQGGGGSPVLRGFEANKILLVVDGVRMNNAIYRSGHLQNSITIDNAILERVEIIYGPTSIMYGSDALGGIIHYITKDPVLADEDKNLVAHASAYGQVSSANNGWKSHLDFSLGGKYIGILSSVTVSDYGDIRMGSFRAPYLGDYGKVFHYVKPGDNGVDSMYNNPDPMVQKRTGYSQYDFMQKILIKPKDNLDFVVNVQYSTSSDINRFDQLNDYKDEYLKYAEWYYGPQKRFLSSFKTNFITDNFFFNTCTFIAAYQRIGESRNTRKFNSEELSSQNELIHVYSANLDFQKQFKKSGRFQYGLEFNYNKLKSEAYIENVATGYKIQTITRYPDGDNNIVTNGGYINYKKKIAGKFLLSSGFRLNHVRLLSRFGDNFLFLPFNLIKINNTSVTGSLSLIYEPNKSFKTSIIASTGFRSPNVDDYGKVRAKDDLITIPNPDLKPEYSYNIELGASKTYDGYIQINGNYFITFLTDAIVRTNAYLPNGVDSLEFEGDYYTTIANSNSNVALIHGFNVSLISDLNSNVGFRSTLNYTIGQDLTEDIPLSHIPPIFGKTNISYKMKNIINEVYFLYSGWKKNKDMTDFGEDNMDEATEFGFAGWYTINLRSTYTVNKNITFQLTIENLLNTFYKPFASGIAAPGINAVATLRVNI